MVDGIDDDGYKWSKGKAVNFTILINIFLHIVCPIVAIAFLVRLLCLPFMPRVANQMRSHPAIHILWGGFAFVWSLLFFVIWNPALWPPNWMELRAQRAKIEERVQSAGGWSALQKACDALAATNQDEEFSWQFGQTNALPTAIAALKPWQVRFDPPSQVGGIKGEQQAAVVQIKFFGMHSTGARSTPYFGIEVVTGTNTEGYHPVSSGGVSGNSYHGCTMVTDSIYEVY